MTKEPRRLSESGGELGESLVVARLRLPSEARLAAIAERLASSGVAVEGAHSPALREPPRRGLSVKPLELSLKLAIGAVSLGLLAILGALLFRHAASRAVTALSPMSEATVSPTVAKHVPARPPALAPTLPRAQTTPVNQRTLPTADPLPSAGESASPVESPAAAEPSPAVPMPSAPPASAVAKSVSHSAEPASSHRANASAPPLTLSTRSDGATNSASLPANTVVDSEVEILKKARNALSADPLQAFALSERCRAQYPSGSFAQEREFIAISALIRLGRLDEARGRASLFRTRYRNSAYLPQLTRMLGEE